MLFVKSLVLLRVPGGNITVKLQAYIVFTAIGVAKLSHYRFTTDMNESGME